MQIRRTINHDVLNCGLDRKGNTQVSHYRPATVGVSRAGTDVADDRFGPHASGTISTHGIVETEAEMVPGSDHAEV